MLLVTVVCSDPDCIEEREIAVDDVDAVDAHLCECGHGFVVLTVSDLNETTRPGSVISLPDRRRSQTRHAA
jgi:hypothetical protein